MKVTGGTQWKNAEGKTHYQANKAYYYERNKVRRSEMVAKLNELKSTLSCLDCGNNNPVVLDFDHVEDNKLANVSNMVRNLYAWQKVLDEIAKCEVVCSNCHRIRTHNRRNNISV